LGGSDARLNDLQELCPLPFKYFALSATEGSGLEALRDAIYRSLDVVRVYTKMPTSKNADFDCPFTVPRGGTLMDVAQLVHKDFAKNLKHARVWGTEVHDGTYVKGDYIVHDKDVVELHI